MPLMKKALYVLAILVSTLLSGCYVETGVGFVPTPVPIVRGRHRYYYNPNNYNADYPIPSNNSYNDFCYVCDQYRRGQHLRSR